MLALADRATIQLICPGPVDDPAVRDSVATLTEVEPPGMGWRDRHRWLRRVADLVAIAGS